jgi:DNA-damage-inducible protein J|nr:MAG TPA_asm: DNA-damage-inducible protein J [Caudoviricetes sp.]
MNVIKFNKEVIQMAKNANINIRIEPEIKSAAENLFSSFGITISDAVNIFIRKSLMEGGIPFSVRQPRFNAETEDAMQEARDIASGKIPAKKYHNAHEMIKDITDEV